MFHRLFSQVDAFGLSYADVCWRMLIIQVSSCFTGCFRKWTLLGFRMLNFADVCWRMLIIQVSSCFTGCFRKWTLLGFPLQMPKYSQVTYLIIFFKLEVVHLGPLSSSDAQLLSGYLFVFLAWGRTLGPSLSSSDARLLSGYLFNRLISSLIQLRID
jgi:hypothetical protein